MSHPVLSGPRLAEFIKRYPDESNAELAAAFGITPRQAGNIGFNHKVKKTATVISTINGCSGKTAIAVADAVKAAAKQGLDRTEAVALLPHLRAPGICAALRTLAQRKQIHQAGRKRQYRYFFALVDALAHNEGETCTPGVRVASQRGPAFLAEAAVETDATVRSPTLAPAAIELPNTARYFSAQRPGQYGPAASSWVNAITQR